MTQTVWWQDDHPALIDQTRLPFEEVVVHCYDPEAVATAITSMQVRGAPAIGVTAAYGIALAARIAAGAASWSHSGSADAFHEAVTRACALLARTRPTAVNLFWAIERMRRVLSAQQGDPQERAAALMVEALAIAAEDVAACRRMGEAGATLIRDGMGLLTHCNAGALATTGIGTATAPFYVAQEQGRAFHVYVDETRPLLQGARLTAWELRRASIPFTLIADTMAAYTMQLGRINAVFVGADRVAANGDTANKIGTYGVALSAHIHQIPFYVVAPMSTIDFATPDGASIPIEERRPDEVRHAHGHPLVPDDYPVFNPAFDLTPAQYITAIITDQGIVYPPFANSLATLLGTSPRVGAR